MANRRLVACLAYKAVGAIPKILYLGHDVDEAKTALRGAMDKGYFEIKVCRDIDVYFLHRWRASALAPLAKSV